METSKVIKVIILLVFLLSVLIFIYGLKDIVAEKLSLNSGFGNFLLLPNLEFNNFDSSGSSSLLNSNNNGADFINNTITNYSGELPRGYSEADLSSYYGRISMSASAISSNTSPQTNPSSVRLSTSLSKGERVNISGWLVQANHGGFTIPRAVEYFVPPTGGVESDIVLTEGSHTVRMYSNSSLIKKNFRLNKCMGYLKRSWEFVPRLGGSCPGIDRDDYRHLDGKCQDIINSFNGSCRDPFTDPISNYYADECKEFLKKFNYASCYDRKKDDDNFLSSSWNVWIGENILDPRHDVVKLFDRNNKLVDTYTY